MLHPRPLKELQRPLRHHQNQAIINAEVIFASTPVHLHPSEIWQFDPIGLDRRARASRACRAGRIVRQLSENVIEARAVAALDAVPAGGVQSLIQGLVALGGVGCLAVCVELFVDEVENLLAALAPKLE